MSGQQLSPARLILKVVPRMRPLRLLAVCLLAITLIAALGATAEAQSSLVGQGVMGPGQRAPLVIQSEPPALTPEQEQLREEAMKRTNLPGPPLPEGPGAVSAAPQVPSTVGQPGVTPPLEGAQPAPSQESPAGPEAVTEPADPGTFTFFRTTAHGPYTTGTSTISETHAGNAAQVVFMTGNWFASYSTNGGASFSFVNPYTQFPALDAGFCCDQTVIYDQAYDLMIWQLQYSYSATTMRGSYPPLRKGHSRCWTV